MTPSGPSRRPRAPVFRNLYQCSPAILHAIDGEGRLLAVSDSWLEMLGYQRDEVIGRKLTDFITVNTLAPGDNAVLPHLFEIGEVKDVPHQLVHRDGEVLDVLLSTRLVRDRHGKIRYSMASIVDVTERRQAEREVQHHAHYDPLTGQPNRILLQERLQHALMQAQRDDHKVGVLFIDLDHFKWVNDTLGHACGDELLKQVARKMQDCVRHGDTVARLGGDEFVIVLYGFATNEELPHMAQRLLETLARPVSLDGIEVMNSASIGIAIYPNDGRDVDTLLRNADAAMYSAKEHGRNNYQFYSSELNQRMLSRLGMETRLRRALKNREIYLEYQPQLDLLSRRITGCEALLRWRDPDLGMIPPAEFVKVAEECGLIYPLGEWVLMTACLQARAWQEMGLPTLRMAVNVSSTQFRRHDFIDMVEEKLRIAGLDPEYLEIELTESLVMENLQQGMERLTDLKIRRIKLAIDDFGTGYSSLQYLKHFPFDRIKIAREFVQSIPDKAEDVAIVEAILAIAGNLNLQVLAEGVENHQQFDFLYASRCQEIQGFYFARPQPADQVTAFLRSHFALAGYPADAASATQVMQSGDI